MITHLLKHGFALCGYPNTPDKWPEGHNWACATKKPKDGNCAGCRAVLNGEPRPSLLVEWPKDGSYIGLEEALTPLKVVMVAGYTLRRKPLTTIPYQGYNLGPHQVMARDPVSAFTAENLRKCKEAHIDLLDVVLTVAFQLGIEQGRRLERKYRVYGDADNEKID